MATPPELEPPLGPGRRPAGTLRPGSTDPSSHIRWWLGVAAVLLVSLSQLVSQALATPVPRPSYPLNIAASLGLVLVAWFGWRFAVTVLLAAGVLMLGHRMTDSGTNEPSALAWFASLAILDTVEPIFAWWLYHRSGGGSRRLADPRSATLFVLAVPGLTALLSASARTALAWLLVADTEGVSVRHLFAQFYLDRALGILVLAPPLLVLVTPRLLRRGWIQHELRGDRANETTAGTISLPRAGIDRAGPRIVQSDRIAPGDWVEITGLAAGASILCLLLGSLQERRELLGWQLWGAEILLVVWASVRQGLPGGTLVAATAATSALVVPVMLRGPLEGLRNQASLSGLLLQAHLLAQCATAVLAAAAASWVRTQEKGYRRIVTHIPVVVYSVRLSQKPPIREETAHARGALRGDEAALRSDDSPWRLNSFVAEITLISAASDQLLGCAADELLGDYNCWLACVHPDDREVVLAAVEQLKRQDQPVTCEYRGLPPTVRWLRDTLAPQRDSNGQLIGWDGIVTDVSEQRALADDLRRTTNMFNALVSNLPTGVFFVQGPHGRPILVNARARQLLGRREDFAAGLEHLSQVYRLHRADGTIYPVEELPVYLALREGLTTMRDDIVVHRPDGRRVPLVTWAAPVQLGARGGTDAAVWVLEDLTSVQQPGA